MRRWLEGKDQPMTGGRTRFYPAAIAATVALSPWAASAQVAAASTVAPGERLQNVDLIADLIYSTNVAGGNAAVARQRGLTSAADEIFEPHVHLDIARPIGRETVYILGDVGYNF
jgi:hypothetical protein